MHKLIFVIFSILLLGSASAYVVKTYYGRCTPLKNGTCSACKNCNGCQHCHHNGGTCSVCK